MKNLKNEFSLLGFHLLEYIKAHLGALIVFLVTFLLVALITFFDVATNETVASFTLSDYEVGQIADRTIKAERALSPDLENPVSIAEGEIIIKKGFPITQLGMDKLTKMVVTPSYIDYRAFANGMLYFFLFSMLTFFLYSKYLYGSGVQTKELILVGILLLITYTTTILGTKTLLFSNRFVLNSVIPASFSVMLIAILFGQKSAFYFSLLIFFAVLFATSFDPVPGLFVLASSLTTICIVRKLQKRLDFIVASFLLAGFQMVFLLVLKIIFNDYLTASFPAFLGVAVNGFFSGILVLGFLTPIESLFNTASVFRLMDLSDLNSPMMKQMLVKAPGTYSHSMLVATLAETASEKIGANPLIARVGAYYHDVGKLERPEYFVENQRGENVHNEINPTLSVSVIRSHVKKGVEKARQLRMPKEIVDIIGQHHGNSVIEYFFREAARIDDSVSAEDCSYIGMPPVSTEAAVVMLADTVEAASHTLKNPSVSRLEKFIRELIMAKYEHHQLDKANLTFGELDIIQECFVNILAGYYHSRIEYPNQKDPDAQDGTVSSEVAEKGEENDK